MKSKFKLMPAVMTVLSALYVIYVLSSETTTLVADPYGGDPGGKVLPLFMGAFLFLGFLYITLTERPDGKHADKGTVTLFLITLGLSFAYVFLLKPVGFVLISVIVLFLLEYIYTTIDGSRSFKEGALGLFGTLALSSGVYMLFRYVTKTLMKLARNKVIPTVFKSSVMTGAISSVIVIVFTVLFSATICRYLKKKGHTAVADAGLVTFATVLLLYIVFKQFFAVSLAPGLLNY